MRKIKIAVSGIFYPLTMMLYFIRALQRREDVELVRIGPFTGTHIPWMGGMELPAKYVSAPEIELPIQTVRTGGIPVELVERQLPFEPDMWLEIDAGWNFKTKPKNGILVHVMTDPHVLMGFYTGHQIADVTFNMQGVYMRPGDVYLPYAFDPTVFYPEELPKENDGCLIGLHYPQRNQLVNRIRDDGYKVHYSIGEIMDENRTIYNKSKVALSWSSLQDLPARNWEAFGMGLPLLCNKLPDMSNFFVEGEHYMGFTNVDEASRKFKQLMNDEAMRVEMGNAAYRKVKDHHTWDARIQQILETVKLI